jgi:indolepyruvate ferredoxin oxidoreductase beta subunit
MKFDTVAAGVGGQGVITVTALIASSAMKDGLHVKQSEVHGMAQRGGAVLAHLRLSDQPIHSDLIPAGYADLILGMEPLESARHLALLRPEGTVLSSTDPVINIPDYPDLGTLITSLHRLPRAFLVPAERLAREAGAPRSANVVLVGAASVLLPVTGRSVEAAIREAFARKGDHVVEQNLRAFRAGREAVRCVAA